MGSGRLRYILLFLFILSGLLFSVKFVFADDIQCGDDPKCYEISSPTKIYGAHYKGLVPCGKCVCLHEYDRYGECANYYTVKASPLDTAEGCVDDRYASTSCIYVPCNFCHFFIMFNGIVKFVLIYIVPPIATLILMIGGIMFYFAGGNPDLLTRGKKLMTYAVIGLALIYGAYIIVGAVLSAMGVASWTTLGEWWNKGTFTINCKVYMPPR